jgi:hypothetical protein
VAPIPNNSILFPVLVSDWHLGNATWGLFGNGKVQQGDVPDGTAYIGSQGFDSAALDFGLPGKVYTVGAYVDSAPLNQIILTAYDANGNVIGSNLVNDVHVSDWGKNYVSVSTQVPIARVDFSADMIILDKLSFDGQKPEITHGTRGDDVIGRGTVTDENDIILAKAGHDRVRAGDGDDLVRGGRHSDKLFGGAGNDMLFGGKGKDILVGGSGLDSFLFRDLAKVDKISDFNPADDILVIEQKFFPALARGELAPAQFQSQGAAADADDRILHDPTSGKLYYDADGNGAAAAVLFARLKPGLIITAEDFHIA